MKAASFVLLGFFGFICFLIPAQAAQPFGFSAAGVYIPRSDDEWNTVAWDKAYGAEIKFTAWPSESIGFALAGGYQKWIPLDKLSFSGTRPDGRYFTNVSRIEGDAAMIPVGGSLLWKINMGEQASFIVETGVRYVIANSEIKTRYAEVTRFFDIREGEDTIEIDDGIIGVLGADLQLTKLHMFIGGGYMFDISKGNATSGETFMNLENELAGFFIHTGFFW